MLQLSSGKGIHVLKAGNTGLNCLLRIWIFGGWNCETAGHYKTICAQFCEARTDASTHFRRTPTRAARAASRPGSPENRRQNTNHRGRDSHRQRHRCAGRSDRSDSAGHQDHHRKYHYAENCRSPNPASATIQFGRVVGAHRIYFSGAQLLERLFSASYQLKRITGMSFSPQGHSMLSPSFSSFS
jgi:hypothetical protein